MTEYTPCANCGKTESPVEPYTFYYARKSSTYKSPLQDTPGVTKYVTEYQSIGHASLDLCRKCIGARMNSNAWLVTILFLLIPGLCTFFGFYLLSTDTEAHWAIFVSFIVALIALYFAIHTIVTNYRRIKVYMNDTAAESPSEKNFKSIQNGFRLEGEKMAKALGSQQKAYTGYDSFFTAGEYAQMKPNVVFRRPED